MGERDDSDRERDDFGSGDRQSGVYRDDLDGERDDSDRERDDLDKERDDSDHPYVDAAPRPPNGMTPMRREITRMGIELTRILLG